MLRVQVGDEGAVDAHQHLVHDFERLLIGEATAFDEVRLDAEPAQSFGDLRAAAVHEHGVDAEPFEPDDVVEDGAFVADASRRL